MPDAALLRTLLLPELQFVRSWTSQSKATFHFLVEKVSEVEFCPRCGAASRSIYDRRIVRVRDAPLRDRNVVLHIRKRRLSCKPCGRPFTELVPGIFKGARTTERYRRHVLWACNTFSDLSSVRRACRCSSGFVYRTLYTQLELDRRKRLYPWPSRIGIDEHFFRKANGGFRDFVTVIVDQKNHRLMELVHGKTTDELAHALADIPGRENVRAVSLDLCDPFKNFAKRFFPNARIVADKFHVLRLLTPAINRQRKLITGDKRSLPVRRLLLRSGHTLAPTERCALRWRNEVLNDFLTRLTNGMTQGFNNKAKLVKRRGYGYRSFHNYRLSLLSACPS